MIFVSRGAALLAAAPALALSGCGLWDDAGREAARHGPKAADAVGIGRGSRATAPPAQPQQGGRRFDREKLEPWVRNPVTEKIAEDRVTAEVDRATRPGVSLNPQAEQQDRR